MPFEMLKIEELNQSSVKMKNPKSVEEKIQKLINAGHNKLQIIADFDLTLSKSHHNGKPCSTTYVAIGSHPKTPESYRDYDRTSIAKYHPIETASDLTIEQKIPFMLEWWTLTHQKLLETKLKKDDITLMARDAEILLRDGCDKFLKTLKENDILLLILSAGLGDILEEVIRSQASMHDNIRIVSNFFLFNDSDEISGFKNDMIHSYNKNSALTNLECHPECLQRPFILLLGDSLGDANMDEGIPSKHTTLKIGYLNEKSEPRLEQYLDNFDIVLVDDQTMDVANAILNKII